MSEYSEKHKNNIGRKFNYLMVEDLQRIPEKRTMAIYYVCKCDCGTIKSIRAKKVIAGSTKSCGCKKKHLFRIARITHGDSDSRMHIIWTNIKQRCNNPKNKAYEHYGGRGIRMKKEWQDSYIDFRNWAMKNGYAENLTIERIDVNDGYNELNCKWVPGVEQGYNKRNTIYLQYKNHRQPLRIWAKQLGASPSLLDCRYRRGWAMESIFDGLNMKNWEN